MQNERTYIFVSLTGAYVDLKEVKKTKPVSSAPVSNSSSDELKSDAIFKIINERMHENVEKAKSVNGIFLYNITKDGNIAKKWSKFDNIYFRLNYCDI